MKDYSDIQFQLDLSRQEMRIGKVDDAVKALSSAFSLVRNLSGVQFRLFAIDIWNDAHNIVLSSGQNYRAAINVALLKGDIELLSNERGEPLAFPEL